MVPEPAVTSELNLFELMFTLELEIVCGPQPEQLERYKSNSKNDSKLPFFARKPIVNQS